MNTKTHDPPDGFSNGIAFNLGLFLSQKYRYKGILIDTEAWAMEDKYMFPESVRKQKTKMKAEIEKHGLLSLGKSRGALRSERPNA